MKQAIRALIETIKIRWALATMTRNEARVLYALADEAWQEQGEQEGPVGDRVSVFGPYLQMAIQANNHYHDADNGYVDSAIEKLRALAEAA